jgi:hypothetical protein
LSENSKLVARLVKGFFFVSKLRKCQKYAELQIAMFWLDENTIYFCCIGWKTKSTTVNTAVS